MKHHTRYLSNKDKQYFSYKFHLTCSDETPQEAPTFLTWRNVENETIFLSSLFGKNDAQTWRAIDGLIFIYFSTKPTIVMGIIFIPYPTPCGLG